MYGNYLHKANVFNFTYIDFTHRHNETVHLAIKLKLRLGISIVN